MPSRSLTVHAYHGIPNEFPVDQIKLAPWPCTTNERKVSLGAYFTTNRSLASLYGHVLEATLAFTALIDLRRFDGVRNAKAFYRCLPAVIPDRLASEVSAGYAGALDPYFVLETALSRYDLINRLQTAGFDGIAFREAGSDIFVPLSRTPLYAGAILQR